MEKWVQGVTYARTASVTGDVVTINHVSLLKDGKHYMQTKVNLANLSKDELKRHAAYNVLIQVIRPRALKPFKSTQIDEAKVLDPCDYPGGHGGGKTTRETIVTWLTEVLGIKNELAEKWADDPKALEAIIAKHRS